MKHLFKLTAFAIAGTVALASQSFAALKVGSHAPDFSAPAYLAGKPLTFKLSDALKKGPVVVYFFPAAHTSGCNVEAHLFSQAIDKFTALNATVIGVTAGNVDQLADFSKETEHRHRGRRRPGRQDREGIRIRPDPETRVVRSHVLRDRSVRNDRERVLEPESQGPRQRDIGGGEGAQEIARSATAACRQYAEPTGENCL